MFEEIRRGRKQRKLDRQAGEEGARRIASWIHVYRGDAEARIPHDEAKLCADMATAAIAASATPPTMACRSSPVSMR